MSSRRTALLALHTVAIAACGTGSRDVPPEEPDSIARGTAFEPTPLAGAVVINDANLPLAHWGDDPWELASDSDAPVVAADTLTLAASYSGGCEHHDFTLVADNRFEASDPVALVLSMAHDANGDQCEAYLTESYRFDLAPVRALYERTYGRSQGVVRLLLKGPEPPRVVPDLTYDFRASR